MKYALLFDLDGTLIDSIDLLVECMEHAFADREPTHSPTRDQWIAGIGTPLRVQLAQWATDRSDVELLAEKYRNYQDLHLERMTTAFPGVPELLSWLRDTGNAIGLVTSKGKGMTERSLRHVGLLDAFDTIVTVEATAHHKPDPEPVRFALQQLGIPSHRALFAGDSPHDVKAGNAAGVVTVACEWGPFSTNTLSQSAPRHMVTNVAQLRSLIESMVSFDVRSNLGEAGAVIMGDHLDDHAHASGDQAKT